MTAPDLDAIEARADAATPEPWVYYQGTVYIGGMTSEQLHRYDESDPVDETAWVDAVDLFEPNRDEDGEFIAHVRADVFALIDKCRKLERALDAANRRDRRRGWVS